MFDHQRLGDHSPEGEGEDVDGVETECGDEGVGVIGHRLDGDGDGGCGGTHTSVVESDDMMLLCDGINEPGIPIIERRREVDEEDDGNPALRP
jgi:hypothetical protein